MKQSTKKNDNDIFKMDQRLDESFVQRLITKTFDKHFKIENDGAFCEKDLSATKSSHKKG